jgi:hypothetical protein
MPEATSAILSGQGEGTPTPTPTPAPTPTPTPTRTPTPAPTALPWLPNADETTVGYVQNKGWTEPTQVLDGYRNLEKLLGADRAGNTVILPKPDAPADEVSKFYDRLGRPTDPAGYKIMVPEGGDPKFAETAGKWFHEVGLSEKQGKAVAEKWNEYATAAKTSAEQAAQQRYQADDAALKTGWGQAYQQNVVQASAAVRALGVKPEEIDAMSQSMGHKATMEFFQKIGSRMGESSFVTGDKTERFGAAMTPGQAKAEIATLRSDKTFTAKFLAKDAEAMARWTQLHQYAYPEEQK